MNQNVPVIRIPRPPLESFNQRRPENEHQQYQIEALVDAISRTVKEKLAPANRTEGTAAKLIGKLTVALEALNE